MAVCFQTPWNGLAGAFCRVAEGIWQSESDYSLPDPPLCLATLFLHQCLLAVMRCENTTPTKTHLGLHHTLHPPIHPTSASGLVFHRSGSIDGPSFSYLSLPEPYSLSRVSTTMSPPLEERHYLLAPTFLPKQAIVFWTRYHFGLLKIGAKASVICGGDAGIPIRP